MMTTLSHLTRFKNQVGLLPGKHAWNSRCEQQQWMYTTLPKQRVSVPLHRPEDRHSLTVDPTSIYALSHVNMAVAPKEVWVPIFLPLGGVARSPHEMTMERREGKTNKDNLESLNIWLTEPNSCWIQVKLHTYFGSGAFRSSSSTHHWPCTECGRGLSGNSQGRRWRWFWSCTHNANR